MKKLLSLFIISLLCICGAYAQVVYSTGFDEYNNGDTVAKTIGTPWTTWSGTVGNSEDPVISNSYAFSDTLSMKVVTENDCVLKTPETYSSSVYKVEFSMDIPSGKLGYYNILQSFNSSNSLWGFQASFSDASVQFDYNGRSEIDNYIVADWNKITNIIDLDNDLFTLYLNDEIVLSFPYSHGTNDDGSGVKQFDAINFYGWDNNGSGSGEYYIDDISIEEIPVASTEPITFSYNIIEANDIELSWNALAGADSYAILRDGQIIAETNDITYVDNNVYPAIYEYAVLANFGSSAGAVISNIETVQVNGGVEFENILFETFTSYGCTYCPIAQKANDYLLNNDYKVNLIDYHWAIFGDTYESGEVQTRRNYYSNRLKYISGTPSTVINGRFIFTGAYASGTQQRDLYIDRYNKSMSKKSCFSLNTNVNVISDELNNYSATLNVNIKEEFVYYTDPIRLHVVLIESNIPRNWGNSYGTFTDVDHLQRKMFPSATGTSVTINPEDSLANYQIPISITEDYDIDNCNLVIFLQNLTTGEVLQSVDTSLPRAVGIDNIIANNVSIYPNPCSNFVNISSENEISNISFVNILGKEIFTDNIKSTSTTISLEKFPKGIYFIKIIDSKGNLTLKKLFID